MTLIAEWDLFQVTSHEILSAVGCFRGPVVRGRLAYVPDPHGPTVLDGRRYRKIRYEVWGDLPAAQVQVLALPGENHYLISRDHIVHHYPTIDPDPGDLPPSAARVVQAIRDGGVERQANGRMSAVDDSVCQCPVPGGRSMWGQGCGCRRPRPSQPPCRRPTVRQKAVAVSSWRRSPGHREYLRTHAQRYQQQSALTA